MRGLHGSAAPQPRRGTVLENIHLGSTLTCASWIWPHLVHRKVQCSKPGRDATVRWTVTRAWHLARISHGVKRIGAPNQRKLFCENDFVMIRGEPRCRQSVSRIFLDLKPSKAARWSRRLTVVRLPRMLGRC